MDRTLPLFANSAVRHVWSDELARRINDVAKGRIDLIPAESVIREAQERIKAIRRTATASDSETGRNQPE